MQVPREVRFALQRQPVLIFAFSLCQYSSPTVGESLKDLAESGVDNVGREDIWRTFARPKTKRHHLYIEGVGRSLSSVHFDGTPPRILAVTFLLNLRRNKHQATPHQLTLHFLLCYASPWFKVTERGGI